VSQESKERQWARDKTRNEEMRVEKKKIHEVRKLVGKRKVPVWPPASGLSPKSGAHGPARQKPEPEPFEWPAKFKA
jgi:hypothetical protein